MPAIRTITYDTINDAQTIAGNGEGMLLANRYRVVRQLGQGGMGSVWLAEDTQLDNKPFAIKMLPSILVSNKRACRQLKDEALVAMKLTHPNIVTLRAFEENNCNPFLVMDYIDGQTLDDSLAEHTGTTGVSPVATGLPEADVLRILRPIAAALDYAHAKGVVHRDVKPGNVMIAKDGTPYILDFGIAREIQETLTRVTGKLSSGTLLYMSPEQLRGQSPKPAQDIYSFAAVVYECLKGEPPFVRGQIECQIDNDRPEPLPGGPRSCAAAVMVGLAKKPEDRPASCTKILEGRIPDVPQEGEARLPRKNGMPAVQQRDCLCCEVRDGGRWLTLIGYYTILGLGAVLFWLFTSPYQRIACLCLVVVASWRWFATRHDKKISPTRSEWGMQRKVQLWEGGPYWACKNIGAEEPWEYGSYFWWGDTVGYKRQGDSWLASDGSKALFSFGEKNTLTYGKIVDTLKSEEWITSSNVLAPEHDAAHVQWGDGWRMPTNQEWQDLVSKCDWTCATMNSVRGCVVRGRGAYASTSIFLPCAGFGDGTLLVGAGSDGYYWSSVPRSDNNDVWCLSFYSDYYMTFCHYDSRGNGRSVRPVQGVVK